MIWQQLSPKNGVSATIPGRSGDHCGGSVYRGRKRDQAIQKKIQLLRRLLKNAPETLQNIADTHPGKRLRLFFQDEARIGQKGRVCRRWYIKGQRPEGVADNRFTFAYIFGAVEPGTDNAFALVLPDANTDMMQLYLDGFAKTIADDEHVAMIVDGAGWHTAKALAVPDNITLVPLPPYSPELNPIERVWLHLKERYLSHRLLDDYDAIADATCRAWNRLTADTGRIKSLCSYPWIEQVIT